MTHFTHGPDAGHDPFAGNTLERVVPTTDAQREVWLADQLGHESSLAYNESASLTFDGPLDHSALVGAVQELADRHEALRSTISVDGEQMRIFTRVLVPIKRVDARAAGDSSVRAERLQAVEDQFRIDQGPLFRATLVRTSDTSSELILTAHHIVCDGWSLGIIASELVRIYQARAEGVPVSLPAADSYGAYAVAQRSADGMAVRSIEERYWVDRFETPSNPLDLPCDALRPRQRTFNSRRLDVEIDAALATRIRQWGAHQGASLFATLFGTFAGLLSRLSGSGDVVIGVPAAGQAVDDRPGLVGHCVSLLPVRVQVDVDGPPSQMVAAAQSAVLDAYEHPHCTLGHLLTKLKTPRDAERLPLVSVLFNLDQAIANLDMPDLGMKVAVTGNPRQFENFELFLNVSQRGAGLILECQYNTALFVEETVTRWLELFREALTRLSSERVATVADAFAPTAEDLRLLQRFNNTQRAFDTSARIDGLIRKQALLTPQATAIVCGTTQVTYERLESQASELAAVLQEHGIGPGALVGILCDRSERMLVALYAILKSGAGYVPLDPAFPAARLSFMVADSKIRVVVTDQEEKARTLLGDVVLVSVEARPAGARRFEPAGSSDDTAYVIYTSGSTGRPKGVCVPHRSVVNLLTSLVETPGLRSDHVVLAVTTIAFDIAVSEVIAPLTVGATVVVANRAETTDGELLKNVIASAGVTFIDATPATWRLLIDAGWRGNRDLLAICTGEPLPPDLGRALLPLVGQLWNGYGPTETTVWSSFHRVFNIEGVVPIGRPIANTQFHVCDGSLRPLPIGAVGELYIGGEGVTRGYLERPELTAGRFVPSPDPLVPGTWYRTGDLGRWRSDATLECHGRVDHQVKVRGYRIELGEIESQLLGQPAVQRALVVTREDVPGDVRIVAYIVPNGATPDPAELRRALAEQLPDYMLPQHFVFLESLPLLPNGKIDRNALPEPGSVKSERIRERIAPRSDVEAAVLSAIEDVLRLPSLSIRDDFFELGGHSLLVAKVTARLNRDYGLSLPLRTLFEARTAERLAQALTDAQGATGAVRAAVQHDPNRRSAPLTIMQERIRFIEELRPGLLAYNTPSAHRLKGPMNRELFERAFRDVVQRQPALRTYIGARTESGAHEQRIADVLYFEFPYQDLSGIPERHREDELLARMQAIIDTPMAIDQVPLFRTSLYKLGEDHHAFLFMPHHIVWDGWSFDLFYEEIAAAYESRLQGAPNPLAALPVTYLDYAVWHAEWMQSKDFDSELAYWKQRLTTVNEPRALTADRPRRAGMMSGEGASEWVRIDKATTERLRAIAAEADVTLSTLTMALFAALLAEMTASDSVVLGVPVRGRQSAELENVMGFFNNLLPVQLQVDRDQAAMRFASQVKQQLLDVFSHQEVPFERLAEEPSLAARAQRGGLYQALFSFQDARERPRRWGGLAQTSILVFQKGATEDLGLWLMEVPSGLEGGLVYDAELFTADTARAIRTSYLAAVSNLIAAPLRTVSQIVDSLNVVPVTPAVRVTPEVQKVAVESRNNPLAGRVVSTPALTGTVAAIATLWGELMAVDAGLLRDTDSLNGLGAARNVAALAAQRSAAVLGFAMDAERYAAQTMRQLAQAAEALGGVPAASTVSNHEQELQRIWSDLLEVEPAQICVTDNFFDLGGSSLLAMRAIELSARSLGFRVDARRYLTESMSQLARQPADLRAGK